MKIGYIGLGVMGAPMTRRLAKAFPGDVLGFDASPSVRDRVCAESGAVPAASITEIAAGADILFSCLPDNAVVRAVYLGADGVASAIRPGTVTIDCSTVGPDATRDVHAGLAAKGASHLDASMLGSVKQANEGTISFVIGGEADAVDRARPALEAVGGLIRHCGPSGAGNHMKLIHQTLVAGHAVAVAEAMGLCLETGCDIEAFYDIVTQGTGFAYSRYFENRVPRMRDGDFSALFMLKFMLKDARLAREMAADPARYPALAAVIATFEDADTAGEGDADFSAAMRAVEARIGKRIDRGA
ncbi:MAG: NAD(P)-dependent oxidoreductase [Pseudomonadota bacterium]